MSSTPADSSLAHESIRQIAEQRDAAREELAKVQHDRDEMQRALIQTAGWQAEAERNRDHWKDQHGEVSEELAKVRAELDEFKALSRDYNWQWQLESGVSGIFEGRAAWLYRNSTRMTQMRYDAATAAGFDFTQYTAVMEQPAERDALIAYLREEIALAEREIALIEANPTPCGSANPDMPFATCTHPNGHGPIRVDLRDLGERDMDHGDETRGLLWNGTTALVWAEVPPPSPIDAEASPATTAEPADEPKATCGCGRPTADGVCTFHGRALIDAEPAAG